MTMDEVLNRVPWEALWNGADTTGTQARYRRILRTFADWVEAQYGTRFTADAFSNEAFAGEVIARYQVHCSARLSIGSVRRIRAALRIFMGAVAKTKQTEAVIAPSNQDS